MPKVLKKKKVISGAPYEAAADESENKVLI